MKSILLRVRRAYANMWIMLHWEECMVAVSNMMAMQYRMFGMATPLFEADVLAPIPKWLGGGFIVAIVSAKTYGVNIEDGGALHLEKVSYVDTKKLRFM